MTGLGARMKAKQKPAKCPAQQKCGLNDALKIESEMAEIIGGSCDQSPFSVRI